jgi:protein-S-isoprenylcysteine O-methyltransferase Ste14
MINIKDPEERNNTLKTFFIGGSFIMCLWIVAPYLIHRFWDPRWPAMPVSAWRWVGVVLSTAGYAIAVWCVMLFIKVGKGTPLPFAYPRQLVLVGPYRFVRNPMVLGTVLFLLGDAVLLASYAVLTYAVLVFIVMHFFVLIEERSLCRRFGEAYRAYFAKTPRWWPKLG